MQKPRRSKTPSSGARAKNARRADAAVDPPPVITSIVPDHAPATVALARDNATNGARSGATGTRRKRSR